MAKYQYKFCKNPITKKWEKVILMRGFLDGADAIVFGDPRKNLIIKHGWYGLDVRDVAPKTRKRVKKKEKI